MTTPPAPVDLEALLVDALDLGGTPASTELPADLDNPRGNRLPRLQLFRLPGFFTDEATGWLEAARVQFAAWGATKPDAFDLARDAVVALRRLEGAAHALGIITSVTIDVTPYWSADPETDLPRYLFAASVTAHPVRSS